MGCIPVDNAKNRAYALRMGCGDVPFPPPYKDSVIAQCEDCGGDIHVGPKLQESREVMTRIRQPFRVLCLLCASLDARQGGTAVFPLSGKQAGE